MDIHSIRHLLKMKSIYDIPLRVTYYARVSSESDEQLNSLGNQITYYEYKDNLSHLDDSQKRLINPHYYKCDISDALYDLKNKLIDNLIREIEEL